MIQLYIYICIYRHFPGGSDGKESVYNVGDLGSIPGLRRSPGEGNGNSLQYSSLENPMDRGVHRVRKSQTQLSDFHFHFSASEKANNHAGELGFLFLH